MLISIGRTELLPASLEQSPTPVGLYFSGVCCPLLQGHCQFCFASPLPRSAPSGLMRIPLPSGLHSMVKDHLPPTLLMWVASSWSRTATSPSQLPQVQVWWPPHLLPGGVGQQPPDKVMGNGHWRLMNHLSAFFLHREAQWNGFAKFSNKKTLCFHSTSHSKVNLLGNFLYEVHVTLTPRPGIVYLPGWYWPLFMASWRTGFVPCLEGTPSQVSRWPSDCYLQPVLPDHSLTVWTAVSFTSVLPVRIGDFSSALLFAQIINLSLFLTWPAVPSTCARLERYITLARFCFLYLLQPINHTLFPSTPSSGLIQLSLSTWLPVNT